MENLVKKDASSEMVALDLHYIHENFSEREKLRDATILITGCAGFLGFSFLHYFCQYATPLGLRSIIGLDNFRLGQPLWLKALRQHYPNLLTLQRFDIARDTIQAVEEAKKADVVLHMASIASPPFYRTYPLETIDANVWGLRNLLDFYYDKKLRGFLFFSTSEIYGDPTPEAIPTTETYRGNVSSLGPRACYDESKRFGETLCSVYAQLHNMPLVIVRPFNNYGPGMKLTDGRVPADFAQDVLANRSIVIRSDGSPTRTFCYVADAIVGYLKALTYGCFECFNIGLDEPEISIRQFAEINAKIGGEICNYSAPIICTPSSDPAYLVHNPYRRCPDITKARRLLHFHPTIGVEEGVARYLTFNKAAGGVL